MIENFKTSFRKPNPTGYLVLDFPHGTMTIVGGPFDAYVGGIGVCLEEKSVKAQEADILFPIHDFTAPKVEDLESLVARIVSGHMVHSSEPVFVGCRGGFGRTGTVIAALVKYAHYVTLEEGSLVQDPIAFTRKNFNQAAVETPEQENVVRALKVEDVRRMVNLFHKVSAAQPLAEITEDAPDPNAGLNIFQRAARNILDLIWG